MFFLSDKDLLLTFGEGHTIILFMYNMQRW
jgi:hypothetical protein